MVPARNRGNPRTSGSNCVGSLKICVFCFPLRCVSTSVLVCVVDWLALRANCPSTYYVVAFGARALATSVLVYVVDWLALRTNCLSTYYVDAFVASRLKTVVA